MHAVATNIRDENGEPVIPASQRPDGTWRKARRVKEGYVPQEEVPLYESKGKQLQNRQLTTVNQLPPGQVAHKTIPGLFIKENIDKVAPIKNKSKKKANREVIVSQLTDQVKEIKISARPAVAKPSKPAVEPEKVKSAPEQHTATDPAKKLKNLKKRLREIENLEEKLKNGKSKPDQDQVTKLKRKQDLVKEIYQLEKSV